LNSLKKKSTPPLPSKRRKNEASLKSSKFFYFILHFSFHRI
jgi:hypothetical protein